MGTARLLLAVLSSTFVLAAQAQRYQTTELLGGITDYVSGGFLNNRGDWAVNAYKNGNINFLYDGEIYADRIPGLKSSGVRALNEVGDVFFSGGYVGSTRLRVFRNTEDISDLAAPNYGDDKAVGMNDKGDVIWEKALDDAGIDTLDYKNYDLIQNGRVYATDINNLGQVGYLANAISGRTEFFVDDYPVTIDYPGANGFDYGRISDVGSWVAQGKVGMIDWQLLKDGVDLTQQVFGNAYGKYVNIMGMTDNGHALWLGSSQPYHGTHLYVDGTDVSAAILGFDGSVSKQICRLNEVGDLAFVGHNNHVNTADFNLYINDFNLTQDLFGPGFSTGGSNIDILDLNDRGQLLWAYNHGTPSFWSVYLSTPVPEPATALLLLPILAFRKRKPYSSAPRTWQ